MRILLLLKRTYILLYVKEYWLVMERRRLMAKQRIMRRRRLQSLIKKRMNNEVLPGKIKLKKHKNDGKETDSSNNQSFEKNNLMRPLE
jgi:hypothetical protein